MRIHKAWYGPKGGHSLLSSTEPSLQTVFRQAAWLTDLPGTAPTGLQWQPYFRTAISEGYFVLIHTRSSRDTTRAGMVDSVAAFIPLSELPLVPDFAALANDLRESQDSVERTPFEATAEASEPPVNIKKPLLLELAGALISGRPLPAHPCRAVGVRRHHAQLATGCSSSAATRNPFQFELHRGRLGSLCRSRHSDRVGLTISPKAVAFSFR